MHLKPSAKLFTVRTDRVIEIETHRVLDLIATAFESGFSFWVESIEAIPPMGTTLDDFRDGGKFEPDDYWPTYCQMPFVGGCVRIETIDGDKRPLNLETIRRGLNLLNEKHPKHFQMFLDMDDDAEVADLFLQLAICGEFTYC